jgi:hypothetical protein
MKQLFYKKVGRKYVPVAEYDNDMIDALPRGDHLLSVYPGGASRRYNIDPAYAPMIAAGRVAENAVCQAIQKASELRPRRTPLTPGQKEAWENLAREFGDELCTLQGLSIRDCADAGVKAMQAEADKLLTHQSVRQAYDHFMLVCELTKGAE